MAKRDYIAEIIARNQRSHRRGSRWSKVSRRLAPMAEAFKFLSEAKTIPRAVRAELFRYFPVAFVGALEGFFRTVYADLIDSGDPYRKNAAAFKELKFSVEPLLAVQSGFTTSGQIISHLLPHKSPSDIHANMSTLLGKDFKDALMSESYTPPDSDEPVPIPEIIDALWKGLYLVFEMRHIICHELATKKRFSIPQIQDICRRVLVVTIVVNAYIEKLLANEA